MIEKNKIKNRPILMILVFVAVMYVMTARTYAADISKVFGWPVPKSKYVSSLDYHRNVEDASGATDRPHGGLDIVGYDGMPVFATYAGTVIRTANGCPHFNAGSTHNCYGDDDPWGDYGNYVVLEHKINGVTFTSVYGHLRRNSFKLKPGDTVNKGQKVGLMGSSGGSTAEHLHFEIYQGEFRGTTKDPNIRFIRGLTFQYFQNNPAILRGMTFAIRCQESSRAFGRWIKNNCIRKRKFYAYESADSAYTLTFIGNGGQFRSCHEGTKTIKTGSLYGALPACVKKGCDLAGWFTSRIGGRRVYQSGVFTLKEDQTLYAHWKPHDGWVTKNGYTRYYNEYGNMATGLYKVGNNKYFFRENGTMKKNIKQEINGDFYFFGSDGKMVKNRFIDRGEYIYHAGKTGKLAKGLKKIGNSRYYFDTDNGVMKRNCKIKISDNDFYFDKNGKMVTNSWIRHRHNRYYADKKGRLIKNRKTVIDGETYCFDHYGRLICNRICTVDDSKYFCQKSGKVLKGSWKTVNGNRYYFGRSGKAYTGDRKIEGKEYRFSGLGILNPEIPAVPETETETETKE